MFKILRDKEALSDLLKRVDFTELLVGWTLVAIGFSSFFAFQLYDHQIPFQVVWKGMGEDELVRRMDKIGAHSEAIYKPGDVVDERYKQFLKKPINYKLYIYEKGLGTGFFWLDEKGCVEDILIAKFVEDD